MKEFETTLKLLLKNMNIPEMELTTDRLRWLEKNLDNKHPDFPEAIHLIATLLHENCRR